ncbi:MAG: hypothetical protein ACREAL_00920 [Nitrosopumilaceae archaeon]
MLRKGHIIGILAIGIIGITFSSIIPNAYGFDYSPMPIVNLKSLPTQNEFLESSQNEILKDVWHSTILRENKENVESYLLYSGGKDGELNAIFYFEDNTKDNFKENFRYQSDLFVLDIITNAETENHFVVLFERFGKYCVQPVTEDKYDYVLEGDCAEGKVVKKETSDGWAAHVKFFPKVPNPSEDTKYLIKWAYIDARELNAAGFDESPVEKWPKSFFFGTAESTSEITDEKLIVNSGKIEINDFLYTPNEVFTENLEPNIFDCADKTVEVFSDMKIYQSDDVAIISAVINSDVEQLDTKLIILDENDIVMYEKSTKANLDGTFESLVPLKEYPNGVYTATVEYGVDGPKGKTQFIIGAGEVGSDFDICTLYLLYDGNTLYIFSQIYDPTGNINWDSFDLFVDKNGDGSIELDNNDLRYFIDKKTFGGIKYDADKGWIYKNKNDEIGQARINKISDGYEVFVKVPNVSKNFRIAVEQTDYNSLELKKQRVPSNSFSTTPVSWAGINFTDKSIPSLNAKKSIPSEIVVNQDMNINLILVGDTWDDSLKNKIKAALISQYSPVINSELHLSGIQYNFKYNFVSAPEQVSNDLFDLMKNGADEVLPFYGENSYENPWGVAYWIKNNHTEWVNKSFKRFDIDYKLIDAQLVEKFLYENLISKDSSFNKANDVNLIFISGDMKKIDFLHNYNLKTIDPSTKKPHEDIGLMGYGGKYNFYFFDLYAVPWDPLMDFYSFSKEFPENGYTNLLDYNTDEKYVGLISNYVNNATTLIITPSYLYPPVYKTHYVVDLVIATDPGSTAVSTLLDYFINEEKILSELKKAVPYSTWDLKVSLEKFDSRKLPSGLKTALASKKTVPLYSEDFGPTADVLDSQVVTKQLVSWASTRSSSDFDDFKDVTESTWNIPVLIVATGRDQPLYIDHYGGIGLSPPHPDDETQPCCVLGVTNDNAVWDDKVGVSDLVIHEVGHALGLMHPFVGYDSKMNFYSNEYFNWYGSVMGYGFPPNGCGYWYSSNVGEPCGNADASFTKFEKEHLARGTATFLIKSSQNNVYRTLVEIEKSGNDPNNLEPEIKNTIENIESNIQQAVNSLKRNELSAESGAIKFALLAASESQTLAKGYDITYKSPEIKKVQLQIPEWIKDTAGWWGTGEISENDFIQAMQYLIKERIIVIPNLAESAEATGQDVPEWIKNNARWWSEGTISDNDFVNGIQYLVQNGIIQISS